MPIVGLDLDGQCQMPPSDERKVAISCDSGCSHKFMPGAKSRAMIDNYSAEVRHDGRGRIRVGR
jgi:hypothetical protein